MVANALKQLADHICFFAEEIDRGQGIGDLRHFFTTVSRQLV
jgi:hypothetical protein